MHVARVGWGFKMDSKNGVSLGRQGNRHNRCLSTKKIVGVVESLSLSFSCVIGTGPSIFIFHT